MLVLALMVKLLGGFWTLRRRLRDARNPAYHKALDFIYTHYLESHGAFIPIEANVADSVDFPHKLKGIFIAPGSQVGPGCTIYQQVTIGENQPATGGLLRAPTLGRNVFVGAGAKIIGGVKIGDGAKIGANAVVVRDVPPGVTVVAPQAVMLDPR